MGWYNGDCSIGGWSNWYVSGQQFLRTYDDFIVPDRGWTIAGLFSNNTMSPSSVTQAAWEIRSGVSAGNGGAVVASGVGTATLTQVPPGANSGSVFRVEVNGLSVQLPPGRYWLNVAGAMIEL